MAILPVHQCDLGYDCLSLGRKHETWKLKCDGTRWRREGKGKLANGMGSQYPSHYLGTCCISITTADAHTSAASSRLNWRPCRFKWTGPFRRKTKSGFCTCAITFQPSLVPSAPVFRYKTESAGFSKTVPINRGIYCHNPWKSNIYSPRSDSLRSNAYTLIVFPSL